MRSCLDTLTGFIKRERAGILLINPGPIAPDFYNTPGPQVGLLHITVNSIDLEVVQRVVIGWN